MKTTETIAFMLLIMGASVSIAEEPVRVHVRYVTAAIWPRTFDATPDNMTNIYAGTRATNIVVSEQLKGLAPIQFYSAVFGTNTPEIVFVSELKIWRYDPAHTNYSIAQSYRNRAMRKETAFTTTLRDGDVVFFHATVD